MTYAVLMIDYPPANFIWPFQTAWSQLGQPARGRHLDGSTVLHADGHAKWYPFSKLYPDSVEVPSGPRINVTWPFWGFLWGNVSVGGSTDDNGNRV